MHYLALATDYDGTLAKGGRVDGTTLDALARLRASGRRTLLVTGRYIPDLLTVFDHLAAFDLIVAENGALLHDPATGREQPLADPPPEQFLASLRARGVDPLRTGRIIIASWETEAEKILESIKDQGLELQLIFNKGSLMVLPTGVNKATGLAAALKLLNLDARRVVAVGDAENDHALLKACGLGVAVANALPSLKEDAGLVTKGDHGAGVVEAIEMMLRE